jgi:hypothetical protein
MRLCCPGLALAALFCIQTGCRKPAPPAEPDSYRYIVRVVRGGPQAGILVMDGKEVGPLDHGSAGVTLSSSEWLTERDLRLRVDTTCGPEDLKLQFMRSREFEAKQRERAGLKQIEYVNVKAEDLSTAIVYLDTRSGAATDVMVGKQMVGNEQAAAKQAAAKQALAKQALANSNKSVVQVGRCEEARKISIGGTVVGELAPTGKATLVDVPGGQCARLEAVNYGVSGMNERSFEVPQTLKDSRAYEVPLEITHFFTSPPSQVKIMGGFSVRQWSLSACL